jgi:hypothetical protein
LLLLLLCCSVAKVSAFVVPPMPARSSLLRVVVCNGSRHPLEAAAAAQGPVVASLQRRLLLGALATTITTIFPSKAHATIGFFTADQDRRQLELCLVAVLRVLYWAQSQADALQVAATYDERRRKYLEARLGAKAILTGKVSGGATGKVYTLATLQLPACLADIEWHADHRRPSQTTTTVTPRQVSDWRHEFSEGLAAIVEFDGLEALIDPSPRSSLTLSQYNDNKAVFVQRVLNELVLPTGKKLVDAFGPEARQLSEYYVQQYYSSEIPHSTTEDNEDLLLPATV